MKYSFSLPVISRGLKVVAELWVDHHLNSGSDGKDSEFDLVGLSRIILINGTIFMTLIVNKCGIHMG